MIENLIKKWALQNALRYGAANVGPVISKIVAENPELKNKIKEIKSLVEKIVKEVNALKPEIQREQLEKIAPELLEKQVEKKEFELKALPKAEKGKVVMRFAPSPSGPLHIGHAYVLGLLAAYAKKYDGKLILRIEDTNPTNIYPKAYEMLVKDANWLTEGGISEVVIQSDRIHTYLDYAEKLIAMGTAYVCTCNSDFWRSKIMRGKPCPCRDLKVEEQLQRWDKMFTIFEPGQAVVRIKTDLKAANPALRDWPALRIIHAPHPKKRTEEKVWPLMNFSVAIDDHDLRVTHTIRGKDHIDNEKKQDWIYKYFNWQKPIHLYVGRINFIGFELSTTEVRKKIEYGHYKDWSDIRLPFLAALRKRGFQPQALIKFAISLGLTQHDKTVTVEEFWKILNAFNKEILEPIANRYFFIWDPVRIKIKSAPKQSIKIALHPDYRERGWRSFETKDEFLITRDDFNLIKEGKLYRLMECLNFKKIGEKFVFDSLEVEKFRAEGKAIMHWLPTNEPLIPIEVHLPDGTKKVGFGEKTLLNLNIGDVIQFERFAFCRLNEKIGNKLIFWFTHK